MFPGLKSCFAHVATNKQGQSSGHQFGLQETPVQSDQLGLDPAASIPAADSAVHIQFKACIDHERTVDCLHHQKPSFSYRNGLIKGGGANIVLAKVSMSPLESTEQKIKERLFLKVFLKTKGLATSLPSENAYSEKAYLYYKQHGYCEPDR